MNFGDQHPCGAPAPYSTSLVLPLARIGVEMTGLHAHRPYNELHGRLEEQALTLVRIAYPDAELLHRSTPGLLIFSIGPLWFWFNEDAERPHLAVVPEPNWDIQMHPHGLQMDDHGLTSNGLFRLQQCVSATTAIGQAYNQTNLSGDAFTAHYGYTKRGHKVRVESAERRREFIYDLFERHDLTPLSAEELSAAC